MKNLTALSDKFNRLTARERGIVFAAALIGLMMLASMPLENLFKSVTQARGELAELNRVVNTNQAQIELYQARLAEDPNKDYRQRKLLLAEDHAKLDALLDEQLLVMVPAQRMPAVLAQMLGSAAGLKLLAFESIAPVPLLSLDKSVSAIDADQRVLASQGSQAAQGTQATQAIQVSQASQASQGIQAAGATQAPAQTAGPQSATKQLNLYSHGIRLTLEGDYFSLLKFVQMIENMKHKLYWQRLDYQVALYPKAKVTLTLHTLSINKDFISVANY